MNRVTIIAITVGGRDRAALEVKVPGKNQISGPLKFADLDVIQASHLGGRRWNDTLTLTLTLTQSHAVLTIGKSPALWLTTSSLHVLEYHCSCQSARRASTFDNSR